MDADLAAYVDAFDRRDWQTLTPDAVEEPVRVAVVGAGWFTRAWALAGIRRSAFTEATVVTDVDADAVAAVAEEHDLTGVTPERFRAGDVAEAYDAVYVATPNATHPEYVAAAAEQGVAVLCEKPLAATVDGARAAVDACDDAGVPLMVGYRMQTDPTLRRVNELLEAGFVGEPVHLHATMSQTMLGELSDDADQWRLDLDRSGGCALMDIGIYPLNTARFLLDATPETVYGRTRSERPPFEGVDEHASFQLHFPDGVEAHCTASQHAAHASRLELTGTDGRLILDPAFYERDARAVTVVRDGVTAALDVDPVHQLEEEFAYFGHQLLTDAPFGPDGEHGLTDVRVLDAVYESADSGAPVAVE